VFGAVTDCESITFHPASELLVRWKEGDPEALEALVLLVYKELRDIARRYLRRERPRHTLTARVVHQNLPHYGRGHRQKNGRDFPLV
jgi:hypothetical protein